ncbi:MAG: hypothetical protein ACAH81_10295 [Actinomycetota bacterium]
MRRVLVGVFVAALLLSDAGSSLASVEEIGRCRDTCEVAGRVRNPRQLTVAIRSPASLDYSVDWTSVCRKWSGRERRKGYFVNETPLKRHLSMAYWRPDKCRVRVYADVVESFPPARATVALWARV